MKPPLGLIPEFLHEEDSQYHRLRDLVEAIQRYSEASQPIPEEWAKELARRIDKYRDLKYTKIRKGE